MYVHKGKLKLSTPMFLSEMVETTSLKRKCHAYKNYHAFPPQEHFLLYKPLMQ